METAKIVTERGIDFIGTVRANRVPGLPEGAVLKRTGRDKKEHRFLHMFKTILPNASKLICTAWQENKSQCISYLLTLGQLAQ